MKFVKHIFHFLTQSIEAMPAFIVLVKVLYFILKEIYTTSIMILKFI